MSWAAVVVPREAGPPTGSHGGGPRPSTGQSAAAAPEAAPASEDGGVRSRRTGRGKLPATPSAHGAGHGNETAVG